MINFILFGSFFVLLLLNVPIAASLGLSSAFAMLYSGTKFTVIPTNIYNGMAKFLLLAIPFFVISGNVMAEAGISRRLVDFIDDCIGHQKGGIAIVCVIVAMFFGAISGSGPATVAALGIILIPAMINSGGFSAPFASALMAAASSISTMKVERPRESSSEAPMRVKMRSMSPISASSAGTNEPMRAKRAMSAHWRI